MRYPFALFDPDIDLAPIFPNLDGAPFVADFSHRNPHLLEIDVSNPHTFQKALEEWMAPHQWGFGDYLENRESLLRDYPQMVDAKRFYHLGIDIIVPCRTRLHAPLSAVVADAGYEAGAGNYGGFVLLVHESPAFETFFSFYGHLSRALLPPTGRRLNAGDIFAATGDFHENGHWFYHTHLQVVTAEGLRQGYDRKGYCAREDLYLIRTLCPSPLALFQRSPPRPAR